MSIGAVSRASAGTHDDIHKRVMSKVARRPIPLLGPAYMLNFLDRSKISFAKLTMSADLGLTETMYGLATGLFFIGYIGWLIDLTGSARLGLWVVGILAVAGAVGLLAMNRTLPTQQLIEAGAQ